MWLTIFLICESLNVFWWERKSPYGKKSLSLLAVFSADLPEVMPGILEGHKVFKYWDWVTSEELLQIYISLIHHSVRQTFSNNEPDSLSPNHGLATSIFMPQHFNVSNSKVCHGQNP